jgi:ubiquinone/menaquinone biosynthesis C-methylase UbiE
VQKFNHKVLVRFLGFFFDLLYHQMAWTYDLVAGIVSVGQWNNWVRSVIPDLPGQCVLELGHGPGHLQKELLLNASLSIGLDQSKQMGRLALRRLRKRKLPYRLINGQAQHLPFPMNTFDQVAVTFPSEYIADPSTLAEIYRVLSPGGKAVVVPIAWILGRNIFDKLSAWLFRVTGQAGDWKEYMLRSYENIGFQAWVEYRRVTNANLLIIHAKKPGTKSPQ